MVFTRSVSCFLLLIIILGCEESSNSNPVLDINGSWVSLCGPLGSDDDSFVADEYLIYVRTFNIGSLSILATIYSDPDCVNETGETSTLVGSYSIGESIISSSGLDVYEINLTTTIQNVESTRLDIVRRDDNKLYFGASMPENSRPIDLDFANIYTLQ